MTAGESKLNLLKAATWTFGREEDQSAYRSELTGVVLGLSIIATMVEYFNLTEGEVEFVFDNKSGEHKVENLTDNIHITNKCFDLLQDIKHCLELLPIQVGAILTPGIKNSKFLKPTFFGGIQFMGDLKIFCCGTEKKFHQEPDFFGVFM